MQKTRKKHTEPNGICENTTSAKEGEGFDWGVVVMVGKAASVFWDMENISEE